MVVEHRLVTIEEYEAFLAEHPDGLYELVHGEIVEKMVSQEHGVIATKISARLAAAPQQHPYEMHLALPGS